jgi:hypothetical protein
LLFKNLKIVHSCLLKHVLNTNNFYSPAGNILFKSIKIKILLPNEFNMVYSKYLFILFITKIVLKYLFKTIQSFSPHLKFFRRLKNMFCFTKFFETVKLNTNTYKSREHLKLSSLTFIKKICAM